MACGRHRIASYGRLAIGRAPQVMVQHYSMLGLASEQFCVCRSRKRPAPEGERRWQRRAGKGVPAPLLRRLDLTGNCSAMPRRGGQGRAPPSGVVRLLVYGAFPSIPHWRLVAAPLGTVAEAQRQHVLTEERLAARHAVAPTDLPDHGGVKVTVQHRLAAHPSVISPAFRLNESLIVALRASRGAARGYSRFSPLPPLPLWPPWDCGCAGGAAERWGWPRPSRHATSQAGSAVTSISPTPRHGASAAHRREHRPCRGGPATRRQRQPERCPRTLQPSRMPAGTAIPLCGRLQGGAPA